MKITVMSYYWPNYRPLAERTVDENLREYAKKHGYEFIAYALETKVEEDTYKASCEAGVKKAELVLRTLKIFPDADYVFHRDCDSIIMNMGIGIEEIISRYPYDILTGSDKAGISDGQMIVKNTEKAKKYISQYLANRDNYEHQQDFMWTNPAPFLFGTPQRVMNSYDCESRLEPLNDESNYQGGDFLIHLTGLTIEQRMKVLEKWMGRVNHG